MAGIDKEFDDNLPLIIYTSRDTIRLYFVGLLILFYFVDPVYCIIISNGNEGV